MASLLVSLFLITCAPEKTISTPEQISPAVKSEVVSDKTPKAAWELEWDKTLAEAKREKRLILYTTTQAGVRQALSEGFKKRTELDLDIVTGRGGEIAAKLLSERRAGLYLADFYLGGTTTLFTQLKPSGVLRPIMPELFLPEVLDTKLWYKGVLPFMDKEKLIMQTRLMPGGSQMDTAFDPSLVNKEEIISWYDLLKPKFKGKMNLQDPTSAGKGGNLLSNALAFYGLNWDYMRALAKQEPVITRDQRLMIEWVARGKHVIAINPDHDTFYEFKQAGANLGSVIFKETIDLLGGGSSGVGLIANSSRPNAAKLFLNWFLSKEGQTIFSRSYQSQSAREDTPVDHLADFQIRKPNMEYAIETEEFVLNAEKLRPMALEIFGPLLK